MITNVKIEHFKKFIKAEFQVNIPLAIFVGQNNGGKTTALQAINLWSFFISQWKYKKGGGTAKLRMGAPVSRVEIHPAPVQEIIDLWTNGEVRVKGETSKNIPIRIILSGVDDDNGKSWEYGIEATFSNRELLHCRPIDPLKQIPREANRIFQLPPLSGVRVQEQRADSGYQFRAMGEGRPGEILRNLLLEVYQNDKDSWNKINKASKEFFSFELLPISYNPESDPFISIYYYHSFNKNLKNIRKLEIASAGSGFLQFLLIAAFLFSHKNSVLLLDEPDSHMHVFLQRTILDWIKTISIEKKTQVIISTHSEIIIDSSKVTEIVGFFKSAPKNMSSVAIGRGVKGALSEISPSALINVEWKKKIVILEGESDRKLLLSWAEVLNHPVKNKLDETFFYYLGTNNISKAMAYFKSLQAVIGGDIKAFCLRDNDPNKTSNLPTNFKCAYWELHEIENYLIFPNLLIRFCENIGIGGLFGVEKRDKAEEYLKKVLAPNYYNDPHNYTDLFSKKGSDFLKSFFKTMNEEIEKADYWKIALKMKSNEVFPEIKNMLNELDIFLR